MKVRGKYNFLLLHDDGVTRSFRLSRRAVTLLLIIAVLLPVVGGGGVWLGWRAWQDRRIWEQEERVLQQEMAALRVQLDRLAHVERLIQLYESGKLPEADARIPAEIAQEPPPAAAVQVPVQPQTVSPQPPSSPPADAAAVPATPTETDPTSRIDTPQEPEAAPPDPDKVAVDSGQVRIDAVFAQLSKERRLRVRMDLYNESGRQIAGTLSFFLLTVDEARTPLPHNDASFRISRLKKFASTLTIPDAAGDLTNAALMVEVVNSDKTLLFRQMYPLAAAE